MSKILGLDLGTSSTGWGVIQHQQILGTGVRVFPEGVANLGEGTKEISKNAARRDARQVRRQGFRRKLRKRMLLELLMQHGMCPLEVHELQGWKNTGQFPRTEALQQWFALNPYELRDKAVRQRIGLHELGRILYHMAQRRGFLSNSRNAADASEEGILYEGKPQEGKTGIDATNELIQAHGTLGSALHTLQPTPNASYRGGNDRARNRYTTRSMYVAEFEAIWAMQATHHPELNNTLKTQLGGRKKEGYAEDGILFYQRPLRTQKHLVGNCTLEPKKPRCLASALPFEQFRAMQFINSIDCNNHRLSAEERSTAFEFLLRKDRPKLSALRKKLKKDGPEYNFNYEDDDKCPGCTTISKLSSKKFFGEHWFGFSEKEQEDIWHVLMFFDDRKRLTEYAIAHWGFDRAQAEAIAKFRLPSGYAGLSRKAICNILPFLKQGFEYDVAVALGGVRNAFGSHWQALGADNVAFLLDKVPQIVRSGVQGGYLADLHTLLKSEFGFTQQQLNKLYHHSVNIHAGSTQLRLPLGKEADREIMAIRNPVVVQALFELRKLINELLERFGPFDEVKIELARDLKISKMKRQEIRRENKRLETVNDYVIGRLREYGQPVSHESILKYKLWEECEHRCPFTGKSINIQQLFSGEVQIEHIFPWSRSLDDSFMNKTLCFADENRKKGNRTPFEYFTRTFGEEKWAERKREWLRTFVDTRQLPEKYFPNRYQKFKRLAAEKLDEGFVKRQLNDTRYLSRTAAAYLKKVCPNVRVASGQLTANLRKKWGLNSVLGKLDDKEREDHRHHAIDALVMACSTESHLQELTNWNRYDRNTELREFPLPWPSFVEDARQSIAGLLVSHKKNRRVLTKRMHRTRKHGREHQNLGVAARGQLHKDTVYGPRTGPDGKTGYHIRKPLESISTRTHVGKIVDRQVRQLVEQRIEALGGYVGNNVPKGAFFEADAHGVPQPCIFLPNRKGGDPVPVRKVRLRETVNSARMLKDGKRAAVNPGNNHHTVVYERLDGTLAAEVVPFWDAVQRVSNNLPPVRLPSDGKRIITTLQINDMFLLGLDNPAQPLEQYTNETLFKHLYKVQKTAGGSYFLELCFRPHQDARPDKTAKTDYVYIKNFGEGKTGWHTYKPRKVTITATGELKPVTEPAIASE